MKPSEPDKNFLNDDISLGIESNKNKKNEGMLKSK